MTATVRLHPLDAVSGMRRYLFLLLIPLVRGLAAIGDGWMDWLRGAWIDLCVLAAMLLLGFLRWRHSRLRLSDGRMTYSRGLFFQTEDIFFAEALSSFRISRPFYLRPVRAAVIQPETLAREAKVLYPILVHYSDIRMLERLFLQSRGDRVRVVARAKPSAVALAAAASSSAVGGLTFAAAFLSNTARFAGENAADNFLAAASRFVHRVSFGLPPAVVIPLVTLLVAYLLAFLRNLTEYYRFTVSRSSRSLYVGGGLFTRYHFQARVAAIESIDLRFGLISRWFAGVNVYVNAAGLGLKTFTPAVIPAGGLKDAVCQLRRLLPEFGSLACPIKTDPKAAFSRYMTLPLLFFFLTAAAGAAAGLLFPELTRLIVFWSVMLCAAVAWVGAHRFVALRHTGIGVYQNHLCVMYGRGYLYHRVYIPRAKLVRISVSQSRAQQRRGLCTVAVYDMARRRRRHIVRTVDYGAVCRALDLYGYPAERQGGSGGFRRAEAFHERNKS